MFKNYGASWLRFVLSLLVLISTVQLYAVTNDVPGAILKLTAVVSTNTAKLSWVAPAAPDMYPITDYIIQYKEQGKVKYITATDEKNTLTKYTLQNLNPGTTYTVRILILNSRGVSPYKVFRLTTKKNTTPGVCGSMNNATISVFPTGSALCISGQARVVDIVGEDGEYNWMCLGINSARNETCQAQVNQYTGAGGDPAQTAPKLLQANPTTYTGEPGKKLDIKLFWELLSSRDKDYLQFMHLDNGFTSYSVDDHDFLYISSTNKISDTRTVKIPATISNGQYNILVGLSGLDSSGDWVNHPLQVGPGVTNLGDNRYKVGTLFVSDTPGISPVPTPAPNYTYSWSTGSWGNCSLSCGGGTQTRNVTCTRNDGQAVNDSFCSTTKPTLSESCNIASCTPTPAPTPTPSQNQLTTINLASPQSYNAVAGTNKTMNLNWIRHPLGSQYLQFMHLENGDVSFSIDDHMVDSANWSGNAVDTRTVTIPSSVPSGKYDILVGLSGGNPWANIALNPGNGVTNVGSNRYKVGTINITGINTTPTPTPSPTPAPSGGERGPRVSNLVNSGPINVTANGQVVSGLKISTSNGPCININGFNGVVVRDNEIGPCGTGGYGTAHLTARNVSGLLVDHNRFVSPGQAAINTSGSKNARLRDITYSNNIVEGTYGGQNNQAGVESNYIDNLTIKDNTITGSFPSDTLNIFSTSYTRVVGNYIYSSARLEPSGTNMVVGDIVPFSGDDPGHDNYIAGNYVEQAPGSVSFGPAGIYGSSANTLLENNLFVTGISAYNYAGNPDDNGMDPTNSLFKDVTIRKNVGGPGSYYRNNGAGILEWNTTKIIRDRTPTIGDVPSPGLGYYENSVWVPTVIPMISY